MAGRRDRSWPHAAYGQHLLRSEALAAELVALPGVSPGELVFEIGAGTGRLTRALADAGATVVAVELDPVFADDLVRRFRSHPAVSVVRGDVLEVPLPDGPYRALGNLPFGITTAILRRLLDDPRSGLTALDVIVQYELARKRASVWPSTLLSLAWGPWWRFELVRRIPAAAFDPRPSVDAALLSVRRRVPPLLPVERRREFVRLAGAAFRHSSTPVRRSLRGDVPSGAWKQLARDRGLQPDAAPRDLDVFDWIALFRRRVHGTPSRY